MSPKGLDIFGCNRVYRDHLLRLEYLALSEWRYPSPWVWGTYENTKRRSLSLTLIERIFAAPLGHLRTEKQREG